MAYVPLADTASAPDSLLLQACVSGDAQAVCHLLASGVDPGAPTSADSRGRSPLHVAAARGHASVCGALLRAGAESGATDAQGNTALHLCGHGETARLLVAAGLRADTCNHQGATPLMMARRRGVPDDVLRLLEALEEQHGGLSGMAVAENDSVLERLLSPGRPREHAVMAGMCGLWRELISELGLGVVLLLLAGLALLSLAIAYFVSLPAHAHHRVLQ
uniref:ankyrin repeat domain-containing protein 46-like n=1 Tax=Myxine glutinosa TaxID=7769 RepID=UPI00358FAFFD